MKHDSSAGSWLKFFSTAGIPKEFSETYAVTFSKNQINLDMLPEIKKEYLVDMGISLMGHIIAILRHAKAVHDETVKKTALSNGNKAAPKENQPVKISTLTVKKDSNNVESPKVKAKPVLKPQPAKVQQVATPKAATSAPQKRSLDTISEKPAKMVKTVHLKADASKSNEMEKKKVFARLGSDTSTNVSNGESVFARLGGKTTEPTVIRTPAIKHPLQKTAVETRKPENVIRLNGISRPTPKVPTIVKRTMRADETERKILKTKTIKSNVVKANIRARLGNNKVQLSTGSPVKHVTFGGVTKKVIPRVKPNINQYNLSRTNAAMDMVNRGSIGVTGVFSRLGI